MKLTAKAIAVFLLAICIASPAWSFDPTEYVLRKNYPPTKRISLGWFKSLTEEQTRLYFDSQIVALSEAENGQRIEWVKGDAAGYSVVLETKVMSNDKTCRQLLSKIFAFNTEEVFNGLACHDNYRNHWYWVDIR